MVPVLVEAGILQVDVVLIRPEPVDGVVGLSVAEHAPGRGRTLLDGVLPVFHAHPLLKHRVIVIGHVACGMDVRNVRAAVLVHKDSIAGLHAASSDELGHRLDAHADNREVTIDAAIVFGDHAFDAPVPLKARDRILEDHLDPMIAVDGGHDLPHLFAEDAKQRGGRWVDAHDVDALLAQRCGNLRPDESHADDGRLPTWQNLSAKRIGVTDRTEIEDVLQVQSGNRGTTVACASRDQELVVTHRSAGGQLDRSLGRVHARRGNAEPRVDPVLFVKAGRSDQRFLEGHLAAEILLGERRTLVGRMRFLTDEDDVAIEAVLAESGCGRATGQTRADDDERRRHVRPRPRGCPARRGADRP